MIKIKPKIELEFLNVKINVGGGYYDIERDYVLRMIDLYPKYSYYIFIITSKGEKLNIKLTIDSEEIKKPLDSLNILEYSNKIFPTIYLENTKEKFDIEKKDNKLIIFKSYLVKNNPTNFVALEIIPNHNISSLECLIDAEIEGSNSNSLTFIKILIIILFATIFITIIIFIIYIKKVCSKPSSEIDNFYLNKNSNDNKKEKKFELALLPKDAESSSN